MLTGFILAAGFGTRLRPLTDNVPKALVPACGKPLLLRSLENLHSQGVERIGANCHHHPDMVIDFQRRSPIPFSLFHETGTIRGTGGAFYFAKDFLSESPDFFVCNVDIFSSVPIAMLHDKFRAMECVAGLIAVPVAHGGSIYYDCGAKEYLGARADGPAVAGSADFIGMAFYKKEFLELLKADDFSIVPVWKRAREMGYSVKVLEVAASYWTDVGTPAALAGFHFDVIDGKYPLPLPSGMLVDAAHRRAYPGAYSPGEIQQLGREVWCEAPRLPEKIWFEKCVVFANGVFPLENPIRNCLVTPWGSIKFGFDKLSQQDGH